MKVEKSIDEIVQFGYDKFTIETFHEELMDLFLLLKPNEENTIASKISKLCTTLNEENGASDYCTWYLRLLTSIHLQKNTDRFINFLGDGFVDVKAYCKAEVEPMVRKKKGKIVLWDFTTMLLTP